jgi:hypothetical protein
MNEPQFHIPLFGNDGTNVTQNARVTEGVTGVWIFDL